MSRLRGDVAGISVGKGSSVLRALEAALGAHGTTLEIWHTQAAEAARTEREAAAARKQQAGGRMKPTLALPRAALQAALTRLAQGSHTSKFGGVRFDEIMRCVLLDAGAANALFEFADVAPNDGLTLDVLKRAVARVRAEDELKSH